MYHKRIFFLVILLFAINFTLIKAQDEAELTVFAAASLTDAFESVATAFQAENPQVNILFNFGGSSTLAEQLVAGAPADIFASANNRQMTVAIDGGRITGNPHTFAKNRLVLIVPSDNPANIQSLHDLMNSGIKLVVAAPEVPVRVYTDTMLATMAADALYGEAYKSAVLANVVSEEPNVRQVAAKVALGEADAGIVYLSDVTPDIAEDVMTLAIPDVYNTLASYPIALTNDSGQAELAGKFIDFVLSDAGQDILVEWNFISVRIPDLPDTITLTGDGMVQVEGQVLNPLSLSADSLRSAYTAQTLDVTYISGEETVNTSFTGVLLWDVIGASQPNLNADVRNDNISMYIVVTGADGYQTVISWGEIDPAYGAVPVLLAYEENGTALEDSSVRLIVPSDMRGGRYVRSVVNISLRDAPQVSN